MPKQPDVLIPPERLKLLEKKERAHDDYLSALQVMRAKAADLELKTKIPDEPAPGSYVQTFIQREAFLAGYRAALKDFALAILRAAESRHEG